jgi:50S ribosomal protein L16 3-hydroxylase
MLRQWVGPECFDDFLKNNLGRKPFTRAGAAVSAVPLLDWETFGTVLSADPPPDVLVAFRGRMVPVEQPRSLGAAQHLLQQGLGMVVRRSERNSALFAELGRSFAADVTGEVRVQLYATPAGTQTFGWHFDLEDVFVAQTAGVKDFCFRDNTLARQPIERTSQLDFSAIQYETSKLFTARLVAGDWLHIPRRWWHLVRSVEDSLSISVSVMPVEQDQDEAAEHSQRYYSSELRAHSSITKVVTE